jgi:acetylornithine deacetylase/succinyl-diaminopimelate desuccinylase-like protein
MKASHGFAGASDGDAVALTRAMVAIPSVNPELEEGGSGEGVLARQCGAWLEEWGFSTKVQEVAPDRWSVLARRAGRAPGRRLILNGHLDTVGVRGMTVDPFSAEMRDGKIWGRGACDMKAGLGVILSTAAEVAQSAHSGELVVSLTADEEHASLGMQRLVEEGLGDGAGLEAHGAVICEPTNLSVMPAHKGFLWVTAEFRGRAAHGSRPEEGVDAIAHAARFLNALESIHQNLRARSPHPLLGNASQHLGTIRGGSAPSVYPDFCSVVVERRTLPGEGPDTIMAEFQEALDGLLGEIPEMRASLTPVLFRPGTEVPLDSELVRFLLASVRAEGLSKSVEGMTAWVDAAFLNEAGIPAVCFGPGSIAQAHSAEEWVSAAEVEAGARILKRFTKTFLSDQR